MNFSSAIHQSAPHVRNQRYYENSLIIYHSGYSIFPRGLVVFLGNGFKFLIQTMRLLMVDLRPFCFRHLRN